MITTAVQICNAALLNTGTSQFINTFDDRTTEAKVLKVIYEPTRDALLERFPWKFATRRALLPLLAGSWQQRTGWTYAYALPPDCIVPQRIWSGVRTPAALDKIPFDVEGTGDGTATTTTTGLVLLTDQGGAELIYTTRNDTPATYSPLFIEALAWALAVKLCLVLPVKPEWAAKCDAEFTKALLIAKSVHSRGQQEDPNPPSEFTTAR